MRIFQLIHTKTGNIIDHLQHLFSYILINHQVESIAPCWEDVVLQWCGTVVSVDDMAWLQEHWVFLFFFKWKRRNILFVSADNFIYINLLKKVVNLTPHLLMKMANPLSKLSGIGDGGWQEDVMHVIWKKNDGLLPHNTALWNSQEVVRFVRLNTTDVHSCKTLASWGF